MRGDCPPATPRLGVGYRRRLRKELLSDACHFPCTEIVAEQFMPFTGASRNELARCRDKFTVLIHSLALSVASDELPPGDYLDSLAELVAFLNPPYLSDHLAMTRLGEISFKHLSPPWLTDASLAVTIRNIDHVQRRVGTQLVLETITAPFDLPGQTMEYGAFLTALCDETGCGILLDLTNTYINAVNRGRDPSTACRGVASHHVRQFHIVGYGRRGSTLVDSHDAPIQGELWDLYDVALQQCHPDFMILERDAKIPSLAALQEELRPAFGRR